MNLFHRIVFAPVDPLGDGLGDEIAEEQAEPDAFTLDEEPTESLASQWDEVLQEAHKDPEWEQLMDGE